MPSFFKKNQSGQSIIEIITTIAIASLIVVALVTLSARANRSSSISTNQNTAKDLAAQWMEIINGLKTADTPGTVVHYCAGGVSAPRSPDMTGCAFSNVARSTNHGGHSYYGKSFSDIFAYDFREASNPPGYSGQFEANFGKEIHLHTNISSYNNPSYSNLYDPAVNDCYLDPQGWCLDLETAGDMKLQIAGVTYEIWVYIADTPKASGGYSECNSVAGPESVAYNSGNPIFNQGDYNKIKQFTVVVQWSDQAGTHDITSVACLSKN